MSVATNSASARSFMPGHDAQRRQRPIGDLRDVGMVFDEGLHEAILLAKFVGEFRGGNAPTAAVTIGLAVPDPFGAAGAAFEAQRFGPD